MSNLPPDLPRLSRRIAAGSPVAEPPRPDAYTLPEKVLQFGTGVFLRGFADFFIDEANREGTFGGRVVMVGSTGSGRSATLSGQEGVYTVCTRGMREGEVVDEARIVASVSRALSAATDWEEVLALARAPQLEIVVSNTTEVGIRFDPDDRIDADPPQSFPGKLAAVLCERARAFDFAPDKGVVVLPCELIEKNGDKLRKIVLQLVNESASDLRCAEWIASANVFANTLVDRIVPGRPCAEDCEALYVRFGYRDDALIEAEPYRLWAIEGDEALRKRLSSLQVSPRMVIERDIEPYRERKVRILNGTHTIMTPLALLAGCRTVSEALADPDMGRFIRGVMLEEIVPSLDSDAGDAVRFAEEVLDRFANPFIAHELRNITLHQTMKMGVRVAPSVRSFTDRFERVPERLALGFAAYLAYLREPPNAAARFPEDDRAVGVRRHWARHQNAAPEAASHLVYAVMADEALWDGAFHGIPGFAVLVGAYLEKLLRHGAREVLQSLPRGGRVAS